MIPQELSSTAKDALAAYRRAAVLDDRSKAELRARIDRSIAGGESARLDPALCEPLPPPAHPLDARAIAVRIALPLAIAAAVLLVLRALVPGDPARRAAEARDAEQAGYGASDREPAAPVVSRGDDAPIREPSERAAITPPADPATPDPALAAPPIDAPATSRPLTSKPAPSRSRPAASDTAAIDTPPEDTTLAAEMRMLARARAALRDGDTGVALALLATHADTFAAGQMAEDREALRVQALCDAGREVEARARAAAFAKAHPRSPHGARVQKICAAP